MDGRSRPADGDSSTGPGVLAIFGGVFCTTLLLYLLRIYTRLRPKNRLNSSDYVVSLAVAIEIIIFSLFVAAVTEGFGRHNYYVTSEEKVNIFGILFGVNILGTWVSCLTRISVALMLLQFDSSVLWRVTLWAAIGFQVAVAFSSNVTVLLSCHPIRARWDDVPNAKCWTAQQAAIITYTFSGNTYMLTGVAMICDLAFAIMPMFFIWGMNRALLERILISVLMALGLCATTTVAVKIYLATIFDMAIPDTYRAKLRVFLWCRLEECLLLASACAPYLKSLIERVLRRFGVAGFVPAAMELNSFHFSNDLPEQQHSAEQSQEDKQMEAERVIPLPASCSSQEA
ncbi:hypothetical protein DL98DRAFT_632920 [Cadophora sp. DSE1049]|nr:hypothetical protein DL98DRAFT_632920 [Cadophora sp. DSE1049]